MADKAVSKDELLGLLVSAVITQGQLLDKMLADPGRLEDWGEIPAHMRTALGALLDLLSDEPR